MNKGLEERWIKPGWRDGEDMDTVEMDIIQVER